MRIVYPLCVVIDCGVPEKPSNAIIIGTNFTFGASVEYECTGVYVLVGLRTRTCQRDQTWSGDVPFCKGRTTPHLLITLIMSWCYRE